MSDQDSPQDVNSDGSIDGLDADFVDVNGVRTRYYELGSENDETLLLVHGGPWSGTSSANTWSTVLEKLGDHFHVLAPDRLACGITDNPTVESPYEWEFQSEVEHVRDFLRAKGVDECHIGGSSRGMASVSWMAVEHPELIRTIICLNSNTLAPDVGDYGQRRVRLGRGIPADELDTVEALRRQAEVWTYDPDRALTDEYIRAKAYMKERPKAKQTAEKMESGGMERIEREGKFDLMDGIRNRLRDGAISQPILLYWGRHDLTATLEQGQALYEMLSQGNPNVRMYTVDRAGHLPHRDYPDEFVQNVITFTSYWKDNQRCMKEVRPRAYAEYYRH